ncbi:MAG: DUF6671 family protein [Cyanobium sp.]|nr:DUF6671 family protein [Synechococcaceae cyanobacterium]
MNQAPCCYVGARVALATRHGKERVIGRALRHGLGARLLHLPDLDTDQLGSFCGTIPRRGDALTACRAKAELALRHGGTGLAIASEGSFGPHPELPMLAVGLELMLFLDTERQLSIAEQLLARRTNFSHWQASARELAAPEWPLPFQDWLLRVGFPSHALLVRAASSAAPATTVVKGIHSPEQLRRALLIAASASANGQICVETDMRAHCNPTRMASIRALSFQMMRRLRQHCPACQAPGWGLLKTIPGLPCAWCGAATPLTRRLLFGCSRCDYREEQPRSDRLTQADPGACPRCNP